MVMLKSDHNTVEEFMLRSCPQCVQSAFDLRVAHRIYVRHVRSIKDHSVVVMAAAENYFYYATY